LLAIQLPDGPEPPPASTFHCEAPGGHYEKYDVAGGGDVLQARVRMLRPEADPIWYPGAGLLFVLPGKRSYAGVQVFRDPNHRKELTVGLRTPHDDSPTPIARVPIAASPEVYTRFDHGVLTVGIAGSPKSVERSVKLHADSSVGRFLMCTSGAFDFQLENGLAVRPLEAQAQAKAPERGD